MFVGGLMSYLRYLCLLTHSGVQHISCCAFVLFFFVFLFSMFPFSWGFPFWVPLQYSLMFIYTGESSRFVVFSREGSVYCQICRIQLQSKFFNVSCRNNDIKSMSMLFLAIYTSQQKKRYKGLMLNIFYIEKKNRQKS